MCKTKTATDVAEPSQVAEAYRRSSPIITPRTPKSQPTFIPSTTSSSSYLLNASQITTASSLSSATSQLSTLRDSLPENTQFYDYSEIRSATNNFLAKRYSSSSTPSWRCNLRGKDVIVFQRKKLRRRLLINHHESQFKERLTALCSTHHASIISLVGATLSSSESDYVYLVYDFVSGGSTLADCLRNPKISNFTSLPTWMSRIQIASDLAQGLDYIHNNIRIGSEFNFVHKHIRSSSVIVTEPSLNAKICHFGTAVLTGEIGWLNEISSENRSMQFEGDRGYMSPEFQSNGIPTKKSDVFAFGVVILELLSGEEPVKYRFDRERSNYQKFSVIDAAKEAVDGGEGRLRSWIDRRLNDSFPVSVAVKLTRVALRCVHVDAVERPDMRRVVGKISELYLASADWLTRVKPHPSDHFTASFAPR
ncbi:lysM domain receptor-like kinase 3 [Impatiens glandulifera]|uniref:lysM domain receptor-like kinase 3 n=1 Tax=Impatiens glandulifera TaxID=253017 RepID=UPI001FB10A80|nr:lysM domain receptor-like kinase 3 [Impatiens glandulifera]